MLDPLRHHGRVLDVVPAPVVERWSSVPPDVQRVAFLAHWSAGRPQSRSVQTARRRASAARLPGRGQLDEPCRGPSSSSAASTASGSTSSPCSAARTSATTSAPGQSLMSARTRSCLDCPTCWSSTTAWWARSPARTPWWRTSRRRLGRRLGNGRVRPVRQPSAVVLPRFPIRLRSPSRDCDGSGETFASSPTSGSSSHDYEFGFRRVLARGTATRARPSSHHSDVVDRRTEPDHLRLARAPRRWSSLCQARAAQRPDLAPDGHRIAAVSLTGIGATSPNGSDPPRRSPVLPPRRLIQESMSPCSTELGSGKPPDGSSGARVRELPARSVALDQARQRLQPRRRVYDLIGRDLPLDYGRPSMHQRPSMRG